MSASFRGRDGLELAYRIVGDGRPFVLFHGLASSSREWLSLAEVLAARGRRLILPDMRGHGDSAQPRDPAAYPPDSLVDDGLALVEHLGLDDYDLGGYSLGGRVALRMQVRGARPTRVIVAGQGLDAVTRQRRPNSLYRRVLTALIAGEEFEPGSPEAAAAQWIDGDPQAFLNVLDSLVPTPAADLTRLTTPTLVLIGDQDHGNADALADALPVATLTRVPGDHYTALSSPEFTNAVLVFTEDQM